MFVSIIKYSRKCSSFYFLIMSHDNTYKICSCTFTRRCLMRFCRGRCNLQVSGLAGCRSAGCRSAGCRSACSVFDH